MSSWELLSWSPRWPKCHGHVSSVTHWSDETTVTTGYMAEINGPSVCHWLEASELPSSPWEEGL